MNDHADTLIIGAGQCGLATAYHLQRLGVEAVVLDENPRVGDNWRRRYDSLRLFTPSEYDGLPGMGFPLPRHSWPTGRQMADFLESYVDRMGLTVRNGMKVDRVAATDGGDYVVCCGDTRLQAHQVVIAAGGQHHPRTPEIADRLDPGIRQVHSHDYRNPSQLLPGPVLVVGASHSGADIALETATDGRETWLCGRAHSEVPFTLEGRSGRFAAPLMWFAANHVLTLRTPMGRRMQPVVRSGHGSGPKQQPPLIRVKTEHLEAAGVRRSTLRVTDARDGLPVLEDGTVVDVRNVVWCTGFRQDFGFLDLPVLGDDGWPLEEGGVVPAAPGLYFVGLLFQRGFYSMLIGGAGKDAEFIARQVAARSRTRHQQPQLV